MEIIPLGKPLDDDHTFQRDAIHIAVAPVKAGEKLYPGQDIGFVDVNDSEVVGVSGNPVGIVDPFLKGPVFPDTKFWMYLYPYTIKGLRHHWTHPAFIDNAELPGIDQESSKLHKPFMATKLASKDWLADFARRADLDGYEQLIEIVRDYNKHGEVFIQQGSESARDAYEKTDQNLFWLHIQNAEGISRPVNPDWDSPFSCSC